MMRELEKMFFFILFYLFILNSLALANPSYLIGVYFIDGSDKQLILEFDKKVPFNLTKEDNKLILTFAGVVPKDYQWIKLLPKDYFQDVQVSAEKNNLTLIFHLKEKFNFYADTQENRLIITLFWGKNDQKFLNTQAQLDTSKMETDKGGVSYTSIPLSNVTSVGLPLRRTYTGTPINVDFQEADLHAIFRFLAEISGLNIIVSDKVKGSVTLKLQNVPWDQVFDLILANFGLGYIKIGNVLRIATLEEIKAESDKYKEYLRSIKDLQEKGPLITKTYHLKYIKGETILPKLKELLSSEGKITLEPNTNILIIKDTENNLQELERILKEIDRPSKQVLIEARVVEITDNYAYKLGIRWGGSAWRSSEHTIIGAGRSISYSGTQTGSNGTAPNIQINFTPSGIVDLGTTGTTNLGFVFGHFGKSVVLLDLELSALENQGLARIFASPKILTLDNQPAEIRQGYKIPYLQLTQYGVATTQFIDAVLSLKVTPHVTPDNRISLDIQIEKSTPDWGRVVNGVPAVMTRSATTKTLVNNGETIVIGGIKTKDLGENIDQVPRLGTIPFLGEAFKRKEKNLDRTELIVFITPRIVSVEIPGVDY